jgi:hypothetical protein
VPAYFESAEASLHAADERHVHSLRPGQPFPSGGAAAEEETFVVDAASDSDSQRSGEGAVAGAKGAATSMASAEADDDDDEDDDPHSNDGGICRLRAVIDHRTALDGETMEFLVEWEPPSEHPPTGWRRFTWETRGNVEVGSEAELLAYEGELLEKEDDEAAGSEVDMSFPATRYHSWDEGYCAEHPEMELEHARKRRLEQLEALIVADLSASDDGDDPDWKKPRKASGT